MYTSVSWHAAAFRAFIPAGSESNTSLLGAGYLTVNFHAALGAALSRMRERREGL